MTTPRRLFTLRSGFIAVALIVVSIGGGRLATAYAQLKTLPRKPLYAVATFTAPDSPTNAGNAATLHLSDWTANGWTPTGIAAQYSEHEFEGTTVKATPVWAVHVLLTCTPSSTVTCRVPMGPQPHP